MDIKKVLRTVVVPVVAGLSAGAVAIVLTRPTTPVESGFDVPTDDEPPFEVAKPEVNPIPRQRKQKDA